MRVDNLSEVREYYGRKYKKILDAFENKKVESYLIDETCGKYLELTVIMKNGRKIFVNHGISNSRPYNVKITSSQSRLGKTTKYSFTNMSDTYDCIINKHYEM